MTSVCVFAGSSMGVRPEYAEAAKSLGRTIAEQGLGLVFGGASVGLMGVVADAALAAGGEVVGVLPKHLERVELVHEDLTELIIVDSMHARKATMADRADMFVALPGGLGSLEELFEVWTWSQLGLHAKPLGALNVEGYYDQLLSFLDQTVKERFVKEVHRNFLVASSDPAELILELQKFAVPQEGKWLD